MIERRLAELEKRTGVGNPFLDGRCFFKIVIGKEDVAGIFAIDAKTREVIPWTDELRNFHDLSVKSKHYADIKVTFGSES